MACDLQKSERCRCHPRLWLAGGWIWQGRDFSPGHGNSYPLQKVRSGWLWGRGGRHSHKRSACRGNPHAAPPWGAVSLSVLGSIRPVLPQPAAGLFKGACLAFFFFFLNKEQAVGWMRDRGSRSLQTTHPQIKAKAAVDFCLSLSTYLCVQTLICKYRSSQAVYICIHTFIHIYLYFYFYSGYLYSRCTNETHQHVIEILHLTPHQHLFPFSPLLNFFSLALFRGKKTQCQGIIFQTSHEKDE